MDSFLIAIGGFLGLVVFFVMISLFYCIKNAIHLKEIDEKLELIQDLLFELYNNNDNNNYHWVKIPTSQ